jgi:hypothetical protein
LSFSCNVKQISLCDLDLSAQQNKIFVARSWVFLCRKTTPPCTTRRTTYLEPGQALRDLANIKPFGDFRSRGSGVC